MHCTCDVLLSVVLFCVIVIFRLFSIFSLSLFTRTLSFFFVFFLFITKIERNFTLYMLKKKKKKERELLLQKGENCDILSFIYFSFYRIH